MAIEPKKINYDVAIKSTNHTRSYSLPPEVYTSDTAVQFRFNILDVEAAEFTEGAAVSTVEITTRDGSFFQHVGETSLEGTTVVYDLKEAEGNHAGLAKIQLKINLGGDYFTSDEYEFKILNSISTGVPVEIYVQNWDTLTAQANEYLTKMAADIEDFDVALETGVLATNIAAKLMSLETTYAPEIVSMKQQLEQAATKAELSAIATPKAVTLAAQMTDIAKIYVYTGSEVGYTAGNWYYHNGSAWVSGGVYQATGISDGSIKLSQLNFSKATVNLFDVDKMKMSTVCDNYGTWGAIGASDTYDMSYFIDISAYKGSLIVLSKAVDGILLFDASYNFMFMSSSKVSVRFQTNETYKYMVIRFKKAENVNYSIFMVTSGFNNKYLPFKKLDGDYVDTAIPVTTTANTENLIHKDKILYDATYTSGIVSYNKPGKAIAYVELSDNAEIISNYSGIIYKLAPTMSLTGTATITAGTPINIGVGNTSIVVEFTVNNTATDIMLMRGNKLYGGYVPPENVKLADNPAMFDYPLFGKKWVTVGDSITANAGWQQVVAGYFGMKWYNAGIAGRTTAGLTQSDILAMIPSDADIITVMGGTNDQGQSVNINDVTGFEYSTGTYPGAIRYAIQVLQTNFPNAIIIFSNCVGGRGLVVGENMTYQPTNTSGLTTEDYAKKCISVCHEMSIPCIDLFGESGINQLNRATYIADTVHPNDAGKKKIANVYINGLKKFQRYVN